MIEKRRPQILIDYEASHKNLVRLGEATEQFKGKAISGKAEPGDFAVINLSDMTELGIAYNQLKTFQGERRKLLKFILEDGDVLIASKGTVQKVAVFEAQEGREVVASSNITILRPKEKLRGYYIKFFLETEIGKAYLDYADKGKAVLNLSTKDLLDIQVPVIPLVKQDYQIAAYLRGRADYQRKLIRAEQEWKNIQETVVDALLDI
ncbi:restriction endonuclease subunit S [Streptococcus dentiloxodontae]